MRKVFPVLMMVIGTLFVAYGLKQARDKAQQGPDRVVRTFLDAFLAGDTVALEALSDDAVSMEFDLRDAAAISDVTIHVRSTRVVDGRGTSKFTLSADKDFVRGEVYTVWRHDKWRVSGMSFDTESRQQESINELESLENLPGVSIDTFESPAR